MAFSLSWLRIYAVSLAGIILFLWSFDQTRKIRPYAFAAMWIGTSSLAVWQTIAAHVYQPRKIHLPAGEVAVSPLPYEKLHWMMEHTHPGQFVFQAAWPGIYLPLQLRNPVFVDQIVPGDGTRHEEVALTIRQLELRHVPYVPYVLWAARLGSIDDLIDHPETMSYPFVSIGARSTARCMLFPTATKFGKETNPRAYLDRLCQLFTCHRAVPCSPPWSNIQHQRGRP